MKKTSIEIEEVTKKSVTLQLDREYSDKELNNFPLPDGERDGETAEDFEERLQRAGIKYKRITSEGYNPDEWSAEWTDTFDVDVKEDK